MSASASADTLAIIAEMRSTRGDEVGAMEVQRAGAVRCNVRNYDETSTS